MSKSKTVTSGMIIIILGILFSCVDMILPTNEVSENVSLGLNILVAILMIIGLERKRKQKIR